MTNRHTYRQRDWQSGICILSYDVMWQLFTDLKLLYLTLVEHGKHIRCVPLGAGSLLLLGPGARHGDGLVITDCGLLMTDCWLLTVVGGLLTVDCDGYLGPLVLTVFYFWTDSKKKFKLILKLRYQTQVHDPGVLIASTCSLPSEHSS